MTTLRDHKDTQMAFRSWKEIATRLGKEEAFCLRPWKNMRDRFVKAKERTYGKRSVGDLTLGANKASPPILVELGWLSQFVKHREVDNNCDLEDDGAGLISKVQKTPLIICTPDDTSVDPPISSTPGSLSPSPHSSAEPSLSGPSSAEMTYSSPSVDSSPHPDPSSSPLILLTSVAAGSTHPDLFSPLSNHVTRPSPSTCTSTRKKRRAIDDVILTRLAHLDPERHKFMQRDNEDFRFAAIIPDMLAKVNPEHKSEVKFKIYQMLFKAQNDCK
ncbi:uncharacterized protein LOC122886935 [Siniperca chuatsi]|uniref:uncharacterized protein LOC122886935 n=1 Tax=Siniperca chuatsi TaxID=119488 RepID=UPI001CE03B0C|nr:uncharacterized protein LOC122886935 [Siniperca chuatsi]